jgi:hypothetical protein
MKAILIIAIIALLVLGTFTVMALTNSGSEKTSTTPCSSCGNSCSEKGNCGLNTCKAASGTGSCGCNKA